MNELTFNSQICTTKIQSQRLLELGLKPETADCFHWEYAGLRYIGNIDDEGLTEKDVPAWSLHMLIGLLPQHIHLDDYEDTHYWLVIDPLKVIYKNSYSSWIYQCDEGGLYDKLINTIEWTIKNNHFNKEYLKQEDKHRKQLRISPNKFDITTLKPFDKVLVRDADGQNWAIEFYEHFDEKHKDYVCAFSCYAQCIPYEENKHLLNTANACDKFYKTWE